MGIVIGNASVITLVGIGQGTRKLANELCGRQHGRSPEQEREYPTERVIV